MYQRLQEAIYRRNILVTFPEAPQKGSRAYVRYQQVDLLNFVQRLFQKIHTNKIDPFLVKCKELILKSTCNFII